jgi:hypothetical protein
LTSTYRPAGAGEAASTPAISDTPTSFESMARLYTPVAR